MKIFAAIAVTGVAVLASACVQVTIRTDLAPMRFAVHVVDAAGSDLKSAVVAVWLVLGDTRVARFGPWVTDAAGTCQILVPRQRVDTSGIIRALPELLFEVTPVGGEPALIARPLESSEHISGSTVELQIGGEMNSSGAKTMEGRRDQIGTPAFSEPPINKDRRWTAASGRPCFAPFAAAV